MSGVEIGIAVIGAVAALITAYRDAGAIVENLKERRRVKGALPPSVALETSLREGHEDIERITAQGVQRFGTDFEQGDDVAHHALQSLTIEVQASFLHHLTLASKDDSVTDFEACIDAAIEARLRAVTILNELYLRQQKRASLRSDPEVRMPQPSPLRVQSRPPPGPPEKFALSELEDVSEAKAPREIKKRSTTLGSEMVPMPLRTRKPSWNPFKTVHRTPSVDEKVYISTDPFSATPSSYGASPTLSPHPTMASSPSRGSLSDYRRSELMTPPGSPLSTRSGADALAAAGFCPGAHSILQGRYDKALQMSMKNLEWACHCRKCPFATPADRDQNGRPRFDDKVHTTNQLRWRSLLLFKCHLGSSQKAKRVYRCPICVLNGDSSSTYGGDHHLFEHILRHQGGVSNGVELWGPICVEASGLRMGSEQSFDVCFPSNPRFTLPPSAIELDVGSPIVEADSTDIYEADVFKNQWIDEERRR